MVREGDGRIKDENMKSAFFREAPKKKEGWRGCEGSLNFSQAGRVRYRKRWESGGKRGRRPGRAFGGRRGRGRAGRKRTKRKRRRMCTPHHTSPAVIMELECPPGETLLAGVNSDNSRRIRQEGEKSGESRGQWWDV